MIYVNTGNCQNNGTDLLLKRPFSLRQDRIKRALKPLWLVTSVLLTKGRNYRWEVMKRKNCQHLVAVLQMKTRKRELLFLLFVEGKVSEGIDFSDEKARVVVSFFSVFELCYYLSPHSWNLIEDG
uniref:Putative ovule protein n=1 Tax=Solanum chacoense TaxID=4108 RepID=A0A0V0H7L0_SOLCH